MSIQEIGGYSSRNQPAFRTGRFYTAADLQNIRARYNYSSGTPFTTGSIYYCWFSLSRPMTVASLGVWVVSCTSSDKKYAIGIYADNGGVPGARVATTGVVNITAGTTNSASTTAVSMTLAPGDYWLAFTSDTSYNATGGAWQVDQYREPSQNQAGGGSHGRSTLNAATSSADSQAVETLAWNGTTPLPATAGTVSFTAGTNMIAMAIGT